jgi:wobble nucleotide-excising tRNase
MITKVKHIEQAGIFQNHKPEEHLEFKRYNLLYGWNGSGKTTLARLFRNLETPRKVAPHLENMKYTIMFDDAEISESSEIIPENVKVFNADFVRENLSLEQAGANSILYVGDKNIELIQTLKAAQEKLELANREYIKTNDHLAAASKKYNSFFTDLGRRLAEFYSSTVFARETRNLDRRHIKEVWDELVRGEALKDHVLTEEDYAIMVQALQPNIKIRRIQPFYYEFDAQFFKDGYIRLQKLLETSLVRESIMRLDNNPDIESWINTGRELHDHHASTKCEYCQQTIPSSRIEALDKHFDDSFRELQHSLKRFIEELKLKFIKEPVYSVDEVAVEAKLNFASYYNQVFLAVRNINEGIGQWIDLLEHKLQNPNSRGYTTSNIILGVLGHSVDGLNGIIKWQNEYIDRAEDIAKDYRVKLDKHIVATEAITRELMRTEHEINILEKRKDDLHAEVDKQVIEVRLFESKLNDDTIVLEEFNEDLHRFIGRSNIRLDSKKDGGYVILRGQLPALNLSEGEKSAIGLIYFVKKLREKENQLANTIVMFDDPVSSFDSNHLFQACSYVLTSCRESKQLFILTHNFWFFKIARDWMIKQWNKRKKDEPEKVALFEISAGKLSKAPRSLKDHHSEYQYIFKRVKLWSEAEDIELHDNFILANLCRRLLESFNAFKTATHEGFAQILELAKKDIDEVSLNKLKYFLHKYSHLDRIEEHENVIENIQGEGRSVAQTTLDVIRVLDDIHFESMMQLTLEKEEKNA